MCTKVLDNVRVIGNSVVHGVYSTVRGYYKVPSDSSEYTLDDNRALIKNSSSISIMCESEGLSLSKGSFTINGVTRLMHTPVYITCEPSTRISPSQGTLFVIQNSLDQTHTTVDIHIDNTHTPDDSGIVLYLLNTSNVLVNLNDNSNRIPIHPGKCVHIVYIYTGDDRSWYQTN